MKTRSKAPTCYWIVQSHIFWSFGIYLTKLTSCRYWKPPKFPEFSNNIDFVGFLKYDTFALLNEVLNYQISPVAAANIHCFNTLILAPVFSNTHYFHYSTKLSFQTLLWYIIYTRTKMTNKLFLSFNALNTIFPRTVVWLLLGYLRAGIGEISALWDLE